MIGQLTITAIDVSAFNLSEFIDIMTGFTSSSSLSFVYTKVMSSSDVWPVNGLYKQEILPVCARYAADGSNGMLDFAQAVELPVDSKG